MDISSIISDIVQSAVTKGARDVSVSIYDGERTKVKIECSFFVFPHKGNMMRSLGYEYILKGEHTVHDNSLEFVSDCTMGSVEDFCINIMSANTRLDEFKLMYSKGDKEYVFSRNETLIILGDVFVGESNVINYIQEEIRTNIANIR